MDRTDDDGLGVQIIELVQKEALGPLCDFAESILDELNENYADIPVIGTILGVGHTVYQIRERLYIRKLGRFMGGVRDIPKDVRRNFVSKLENDGVRRDVGEKILLLLDQHDDLLKSEIAGEFFKEYIEGKITREEFDSMCHSLNLCEVNHINELWLFDQLNESKAKALCTAGIAEWDINIGGVAWDAQSVSTSFTYRLSSCGNIMASILKERDERRSKSTSKQ